MKKARTHEGTEARRGTRNGRAFTIVELVALLVISLVLAGFAVPVLTTQRCDSLKARSMANLQRLGQAHAAYAADWNERQFTLVRDDLGRVGGSCPDYIEHVGCHPPVILGADCDGVDQGYFFCGLGPDFDCSSFDIVRPLDFQTAFGSFRLPNARGFHEYLNGRFFDPTFYAPKDTVVLEHVAPFFDDPCEYAAPDGTFAFSASYVLSPAAMYHPDVFRSVEEGSWQDPDSLPWGYESPAVSQTLYPAQKTRMIEHHWLQTPDGGPCNPAFDPGTYDGCEPYYFNLGFRSNPLALFFDGHVRGLSVQEATQSDEKYRRQTFFVDGLWSRDTPLGSSGYFGDLSFDLANTSYHILTTGGIRGRDTLR